MKNETKYLLVDLIITYIIIIIKKKMIEYIVSDYKILYMYLFVVSHR